MIVITIT
jgi:hypothetical protein